MAQADGQNFEQSGNQKEEKLNDDLLTAFRDELCRQYGSVLTAWRRVLDPDGDGELLFREFVEALVRLHWKSNTGELWNAFVTKARARAVARGGEMQSDMSIGLGEISPEDEAYVREVVVWMEEAFGGAIEMFNSITDSKPNASVTFQQFEYACRLHGFRGDVEKIFRELLDVWSVGYIAMPDIAYLETSAFKRNCALDPAFIVGLASAKEETAKERRRRQHQRETRETAVIEFKEKLRAAHRGSLIRGWRRCLDLHGNLVVSRIGLLKACKKLLSLEIRRPFGRPWTSPTMAASTLRRSTTNWRWFLHRSNTGPQCDSAAASMP
jgi:hypothetical protein